HHLQTRASRVGASLARTPPVPWRDKAAHSTPSAVAQSQAYPNARPVPPPSTLPLRRFLEPRQLPLLQAKTRSSARLFLPSCPNDEVAGKLLGSATEQNLNR